MLTPRSVPRVETEVYLGVANGLFNEMSEQERYDFFMHISNVLIRDEPEFYFHIIDYVTKEREASRNKPSV